ncbi:MAG: prepilin-type N-terminal cleavage/methylation domain-containing protein, partial [Ruthenibacterium sp.]
MKNKKGFTLIELIVVLAILAVIAAIAVPTAFGS